MRDSNSSFTIGQHLFQGTRPLAANVGATSVEDTVSDSTSECVLRAVDWKRSPGMPGLHDSGQRRPYPTDSDGVGSPLQSVTSAHEPRAWNSGAKAAESRTPNPAPPHSKGLSDRSDSNPGWPSSRIRTPEDRGLRSGASVSATAFLRSTSTHRESDASPNDFLRECLAPVFEHYAGKPLPIDDARRGSGLECRSVAKAYGKGIEKDYYDVEHAEGG